MIQCENCEFFHRGKDGEIAFSCDPFSTIIEPECLTKWQLIKTNQLVASYQSTLRYYEKFAPMQEKMFNMMEREIDDMHDRAAIHVENQSARTRIAADGEHPHDLTQIVKSHPRLEAIGLQTIPNGGRPRVGRHETVA